MIVIIGESASGKSTLVNKLVDKKIGYERIVTYTTRPMRDGEQDGVDYHFVTPEKFQELIDKDFFVEYAQYRDWSYGTAKEDCNNPYAVAVLTPAGLRALKRLNYDITSIYLCVDRRSRLINILLRGDNIDEAYRRNLSDVGQFDQVENEVDYIILNEGFVADEDKVLEHLLNILEDKKKNDEQISLFEEEENA